MSRPREAIDTAVLAAAVRIDARFETDVGTLIPRDNRFRSVPVIFSATRPILVLGVRLNNILVA